MNNHIFATNINEPIGTHRVLISGEGRLLDQGVANLLYSTQGLEVNEGKYANEERLTEDVVRYHPESIILFHSTPAKQKKFLTLLERKGLADQIRIILINLEDNLLYIYQRHHWFTTDSTHFMSILNNTCA